MPFSEPSPPDNVVVVLLDSLNRHMLGAYGGTEFATPNLDRFAATRAALRRTTTPARCRACRRATTSCAARSTSSGSRGARSSCGRTRRRTGCGDAGVATMLVTDHPHLFETGGENYHADFTAWEYERGHERRPVEDAPRPELARRAVVRPLPCRRVRPRAAGSAARRDFPGRARWRAAARWLDENARAARPLPALRRRVRSARAVRHARALRLAVRPVVGGTASDLAAVHGGRRRARRDGRARRRARSAPATAPSSR